MSSDPPELGKGLFGYRKSAVNQIISDRDIMLRQAEGRVRAAESRVADLENELASMRERNSRMDEQLDRLRQQLDVLVGQETTTVEPVQQVAAAPHPEAEAKIWPEPLGAAHSEPEPASPEEPAYDTYPGEEGSEAHQWPEPEVSWTSADVEAPATATDEAEEPMTTLEDEHIAYGAEVRLAETAPEEAPDWMQFSSSTPLEETDEEPDEVALAGGSYGFEAYDADEQRGYGELGSDEEEEEGEEGEGEQPSPFARFPFTSGPFDQEPSPVSSSTEDQGYGDDPAAEFAAQRDVPQPEPAPPRVEEQPVATPAPSAPAVSQETADITNRFLTEELAGILAAAEESAARIVERARTTTQRQIARSNRVWREVQAEVSRFASWRQDVEPMIRAVQSKVDGVRAEIEEVPERIRQALAPMADAISSIDADLAELASASNPPLLLTPSDLEAEESDVDQWGQDDADFGFETASASDEGSGHLHAG